MASRFYTLEPLRPGFGAVVSGVNLSTVDLSAAFVEQLKADTARHRLLLFRKQGKVSGERQVAISAALGEVESTFYKHPRSPHPDVFRVSNDPDEGCTNVGRTGWHVDGTFQRSPFKYQTMHFHAVCEGGETWFVPMKELYESQDDATKARWNRYWMISGRRGSVAHPLVYQHPVTHETTMLFHCGESFCDAAAVDDGNAHGSGRPNLVRHEDPLALQHELTAACEAALPKFGVKLAWEEGDFAINDNVANVHYAAPGTQAAPGRAGLRVLHRTTIAGEVVPRKADGQQSMLA